MTEIIQSNLLSDRETEVLNMIKMGCTNKKIADQLYISEKTVKFHCTHIYKKLEVCGRRAFFQLLPIKYGAEALNYNHER
ncbi:MAG: DNA-binding NarL/FixJ family response regulator [Paraglaciecola sp.]|jgi:DNA-binding NarL/FixJ family response regulator